MILIEYIHTLEIRSENREPGETMARFIVIHQVNYENLESFNKMVELAKNVRDTLNPEIHWMNSWWASNDELLICDWDAPDKASLEGVLKQICDYWPTDRIFEVVVANPEWFD